MAADMELLRKLRSDSAKRYGKRGSSFHAGDSIDPVKRVPFKSIELYLATFGGAPVGRMIRPWGGRSSCKSMVAWQLAAAGQQIRNDQFPDGMSVCYHNIEGAYDPTYVRDKMGVDISEGMLEVVEGGLIEDVSYNLDAALEVFDIHIIDSASFAQSTHGFEAAKESRQPGFDAQAWSRAYKSAEMLMDKNRNMIVIIDQVRTDFKTGAEKAAGGNIADHASSMSMHHRRATKLYRVGGELQSTRPKTGNDDLTGGHRIDGYEVEVEIDKSRVCRPFGKARLRFDIDTLQFDEEFELVKAGKFLGIIKGGPFYTIPTSQKTIHGEPKLRERLKEDMFLRAAIWEAADRYVLEKGYA